MHETVVQRVAYTCFLTEFADSAMHQSLASQLISYTLAATEEC